MKKKGSGQRQASKTVNRFVGFARCANHDVQSTGHAPGDSFVNRLQTAGPAPLPP